MDKPYPTESLADDTLYLVKLQTCRALPAGARFVCTPDLDRM